MVSWVDPLRTLRALPIIRDTRLDAPVLPADLLLFLATLVGLAWLLRNAGLIGLWRRGVLDPAVVSLAGLCAAAVVLTLGLSHPGTSQLYFIRSASPYFGVLAACGLVRLAHGDRDLRRLLLAAAVGGALAWLAGSTDSVCPVRVPP